MTWTVLSFRPPRSSESFIELPVHIGSWITRNPTSWASDTSPSNSYTSTTHSVLSRKDIYIPAWAKISDTTLPVSLCSALGHNLSPIRNGRINILWYRKLGKNLFCIITSPCSCPWFFFEGTHLLYYTQVGTVTTISSPTARIGHLDMMEFSTTNVLMPERLPPLHPS